MISHYIYTCREVEKLQGELCQWLSREEDLSEGIRKEIMEKVKGVKIKEDCEGKESILLLWKSVASAEQAEFLDKFYQETQQQSNPKNLEEKGQNKLEQK